MFFKSVQLCLPCLINQCKKSNRYSSKIVISPIKISTRNIAAIDEVILSSTQQKVFTTSIFYLLNFMIHTSILITRKISKKTSAAIISLS